LQHDDFTGWPWRQGQTGNQPGEINVSESEREQRQLLELIGIMAAGIGHDELGAMLAARKLYLESVQSRQTTEAIPAASMPPAIEKLSYSVDEAAHAVGISRRAMLKCLSGGDLPSFKVGTNQLILVDELTSWLSNHAQNQEGK
jgi:excisionase family DNA binding protein